MDGTTSTEKRKFSIFLGPEQAPTFERFRKEKRLTKAQLWEDMAVEYFAARGIPFPRWEERMGA